MLGGREGLAVEGEGVSSRQKGGGGGISSSRRGGELNRQKTVSE